MLIWRFSARCIIPFVSMYIGDSLLYHDDSFVNLFSQLMMSCRMVCAITAA